MTLEARRHWLTMTGRDDLFTATLDNISLVRLQTIIVAAGETVFGVVEFAAMKP